MKKEIVLISLLSVCGTTQADDYKQVNIFAGLGYHKEKYDCHTVKHGVCFRGDKLAMIELTVKPSEYTALKLLHVSNYETSKDRGLNAGFVGIDVSFDLF